MSAYIENFETNENIINSYDAPANALDGANILLAWYGYGEMKPLRFYMNWYLKH